MKILVTGGCGFIGSNFILRFLEKNPSSKIINLDAMVKGSNAQNFKNFHNKNYSFIKGNIGNYAILEKLIPKVDLVVNFAAESHVDRSIANPKIFMKTNFYGVYNILEILKKYTKTRLLHISTDEVYGESLKKYCTENDILNPSNPYSASKASAEMLIHSYIRTYDLDAIITRSTNNYGPRQFPEKLIPKTVLSIHKNQSIPVHGKGKAKRQWIHVFDHCDALMKIISNWKSSGIYNIAGNTETSNLDLINFILKKMGKSKNLISFVEDRPGQDRAYRVSAKKLQSEFSISPKIKLDDGIESTVNWYLENTDWWKKLPFNKIKNPTPWIK